MKAETNRAPAAPYRLCKKCGTYHGHACLGVREAAPVPASTGREAELRAALERLCTHEKRTSEQINHDWDHARALLAAPVAARELDADADRRALTDEQIGWLWMENMRIAHATKRTLAFARAIERAVIAARATAESVPASAAPREQWISVDERLPEVHSNDYAEFIVSCTRKRGKAYVFSAHYLNGKLLQSRWPDDDEPEDGLPVSGWYFETEVDGDNVFDPVCEPGDAITHWHALPTAPSNSPVGAKEQE